MKQIVVLLATLLIVGLVNADPAVRGAPGSTCSSDSHCIANSKCYRRNPCNVGTCQCNDGYGPWEKDDSTTDTYDAGCSKVVQIGDSCASDADTGTCPGNSYCDSTTKRCTCLTDTTANSNKDWCDGTKSRDDACSNNDACIAYNEFKLENVDHVVYSNFLSTFAPQICSTTCNCNAGAGYVQDGTTCKKSVVSVEETCDANNICDPTTQNPDQSFGGLSCDGGTSKCVCTVANTAIKSYTYVGISVNMCAHASAGYDVAYGYQCRNSGSTRIEDNNYCISPLVCDDCSGDTLSGNMCMNGAPRLVGSILLLVTAMFLTKYM